MQVLLLRNFLPSLMLRRNKLECLSFQPFLAHSTFFEGKAVSSKPILIVEHFYVLHSSMLLPCSQILDM
jgi:hypothetical protein